MLYHNRLHLRRTFEIMKRHCTYCRRALHCTDRDLRLNPLDASPRVTAAALSNLEKQRYTTFFIYVNFKTKAAQAQSHPMHLPPPQPPSGWSPPSSQKLLLRLPPGYNDYSPNFNTFSPCKLCLTRYFLLDFCLPRRGHKGGGAFLGDILSTLGKCNTVTDR
jgi:hypothetical protein